MRDASGNTTMRANRLSISLLSCDQLDLSLSMFLTCPCFLSLFPSSGTAASVLTQTQVYRCEIIRKLNFYSRTRLHQATTSSLNSKFQTNLFQQKLSFACVPICRDSTGRVSVKSCARRRSRQKDKAMLSPEVGTVNVLGPISSPPPLISPLRL